MVVDRNGLLIATSDFVVNEHVQDLLFAAKQALSPGQCVGGGAAYRGISGVIVPDQGKVSKAHDKFNRTLRKEHMVVKRSVARIRKFGVISSPRRYMQTISQWFKVVAHITNFKAKYKYQRSLANRVPYSQVLLNASSNRWQTHVREEAPSVEEIQDLDEPQVESSIEEASYEL